MAEFSSSASWADRGLALLGSAVIHGGIFAALFFGLSSSPEVMELKLPPTIQATVVDRQAIVQRQQAKIDAQNEIKREQARERRRERERQAKLEQQRRDAVARKKREADDAQRKKDDAERQRQDQLEQVRREREAAEERVRRLAEEREKQAADIEQQRLRDLIAADQAAIDAEANADLLTEWQAQIQYLVRQSWTKPPTARSGLRCSIRVDLLPGGEVLSASITSRCNGNEITKRSLVDAVKRASPFPYKGYEEVFQRTVTFTFAPDK